MEHNSDAHVMEYASFWRRFAAFVLDAMLLSMIFPLNIRIPLHLDDYWYFMPLVALSNIVAIVAILAYGIIFWCWRGQTPGKMLLNIKVLRGDGSNISFGYALIRYMGYILCILTLGLGFVYIAIDSRKQGLHDKIAGTVVVKLPEPTRTDTALADPRLSAG